MARDGSGTYNKIYTAVPHTKARADDFNGQIDDIAQALTGSVANDGQTAMVGSLNLGGQTAINLGGAVARHNAPNAGQVQDGEFTYAGTAGGPAGALTATLAPAITAYRAGQMVMVTALLEAIDGGTTLAVNGLTARTVLNKGLAVKAADWLSGDLLLFSYDGTNFQLVGSGRNATFGNLSFAGSTITSSSGNLNFENFSFNDNTISATNTNGDVIFAPAGTGKVKTDNLALDGNTISATDTNGNVVLLPNGTGSVFADAVVMKGHNVSSDGLALFDVGENEQVNINGVFVGDEAIESTNLTISSSSGDTTLTSATGTTVTSASETTVASTAGTLLTSGDATTLASTTGMAIVAGSTLAVSSGGLATITTGVGANVGLFPGSGRLLVNCNTNFPISAGIDGMVYGAGAGLQVFPIAASGSAAQVCVANTGMALMGFAFNNGGGPSTVGSITTNGTGIAVNLTSDYRLKDDIEDMPDRTPDLMRLRPVTYRWKRTGTTGEGFIAHELKEVVPSAVWGEKDAVDESGAVVPQMIAPGELIILMVSALQSLTRRVAELEGG